MRQLNQSREVNTLRYGGMTSLSGDMPYGFAIHVRSVGPIYAAVSNLPNVHLSNV